VIELKLNSPRGTSDIYGEDIKYRDFVIETVRELFKVFSFQEIITPAFEHTEVFSRSIGESTDIVQKEMYTFPDRKGRSLTLRPEGTASIVRAVVEKKMLSSQELPLKLFYIGNMFRYERPQKGRMREFWQIGAEALGSSEPLIDAEVIWLLSRVFYKLGFKKLQLRINSIGCSQCRESFMLEFKDYIQPHLGGLCQDCRNRFEVNPLRIFDCKKSSCRSIASGSPKISGFLCPDCREHFQGVKKILSGLSIEYHIDDSLVRGFDYYTGTIFEMVSHDLDSAQNALGGGGRYDRLLSEFGGPDMPATGFALGLDRTILVMKELGMGCSRKTGPAKTYMITLSGPGEAYSLEILRDIREAGISCQVDYTSRNIGNGIKKAGKKGFDLAVIIGDEEIHKGCVTIKDLDNFRQYTIDRTRLVKKILDMTGVEKNG
jgi:histidyl-tRNA synthetase